MNTDNQRVTKHAGDDKRAYCCFIGCKNNATKLIYTPGGGYEDYTHSCDDHIEDLKSTYNDVVEELN